MNWENYFKREKIISFLCLRTWKYKVNPSYKNFWTSPDKALELLSTNLLSFYFSILLFSPKMQSLQYLNFSLFSLWTSVACLCIRRITRSWRSDIISYYFKTCNWRSDVPKYKFWTVHRGARELLATNLSTFSACKFCIQIFIFELLFFVCKNFWFISKIMEKHTHSTSTPNTRTHDHLIKS